MTRSRYKTQQAATAHLRPPFGVLNANAAHMARRTNGTPIRIASKSIRCREILRTALAIRSMQHVSRRELGRRRDTIAVAIREITPLEFVNGGGTSALESTSTEDAVTEIYSGSVFYRPALIPTEGAGEVQTPLRGAGARSLHIGGRVWFRHVKAGELCERIDKLDIVDGERVGACVTTYRGNKRRFSDWDEANNYAIEEEQ